MALNTKKAVEEVEAILESMDFFENISTGKVEDLVSETIFPSVYITMDTDVNQANGKMRQDGGEYDRILLITLSIHLDLQNTSNLAYLDVRDDIETAILKDSAIWEHVVDRDVVGSKWDSGQNFPKKQGEIMLRVFTRACVD